MIVLPDKGKKYRKESMNVFISKTAKEIIFDNLKMLNQENEKLEKRIAELEAQVQNQQTKIISTDGRYWHDIVYQFNDSVNLNKRRWQCRLAGTPNKQERNKT